MGFDVNTLYTALLGGAGVKAVELAINWRKNREEQELARTKAYSEIEARLRLSLEADNRAMREQVANLSKPAPHAAEAESMKATVQIQADVELLREHSAVLRKANDALHEHNRLLDAELERMRLECERSQAELDVARERILELEKPRRR